MTKTTYTCGREFLMGVVARALVEEEEDLFTMLRRPTVQRELRRIPWPDGNCTVAAHRGPKPEEDLERWDGLS